MFTQQATNQLEASKATIDGHRFSDNELFDGEPRVRCVRFKKETMAAHTKDQLSPYNSINLLIRTDTEHTTKAIVVWVRENPESIDLGLHFDDKDTAFKVRMLEQTAMIEKYYQDNIKNGDRLISEDEAAFEWISKYSKDYP